MPRLRRPLLALLLAGTAAALAGCSSTVAMEAAPAANEPACADVVVRLPDDIAGQERRWTDAQATAAWGAPATILLTCGLDAPGPSTLRCEEVNNVFWLVDETRAEENLFTFTTFGREPAVQVFLDFDVVSSSDTLRAIATAVGTLPQTGSVCTDRPTEG